jgi:hypothetical protein
LLPLAVIAVKLAPVLIPFTNKQLKRLPSETANAFKQRLLLAAAGEFKQQARTAQRYAKLCEDQGGHPEANLSFRKLVMGDKPTLGLKDIFERAIGERATYSHRWDDSYAGDFIAFVEDVFQVLNVVALKETARPLQPALRQSRGRAIRRFFEEGDSSAEGKGSRTAKPPKSRKTTAPGKPPKSRAAIPRKDF